MAQTLVNVATPYDIQFNSLVAAPLASQCIFGPVTRSCVILAAEGVWRTNAAISASIALFHDPTAGPVGTGSSIVGSGLLVNASAGTPFSWALTGSTTLVPGDFVSLIITGSSGAFAGLNLTLNVQPA